MYGTLFSALTFSISGTNPASVGYVALSSNEPIAATKVEAAKTDDKAPTAESTKKAFPLRKVTVAKPEANKPVAAEKDDSGKEQPEEKKASLKSDDETVNASNGSNKIQVKHDTRRIGGKEYTFKSYKYDNGRTEVLWAPTETEASECSNGVCQRKYEAVAFEGDITKSLSKMIDKIQDSYIASSKTSKTDSKEKEEEVEEVSRGQKLLESINTSCDKSSKEVSSQIECKADKFISYLNKKLDKQKKKLDITEDEALEFFTENIKDGLKEMLTHKFQMPVAYNNNYYDNYSMTMDLNEEKRAAEKEKNAALKIIRNLLRNLGAKYKDVRKEVSKLYNESVSDQAKEALLNYRDMKLAEKNKDLVGQRYNFGSFMMNDQYLRSLDTDLFSSVSSGLYDSKSLMENSYFNQIMRDLNNSHAGICITYSKEIGQASDSCGSVSGGYTNDLMSLNGINFSNGASNANRLGRGTVSNQIRSGSAGSSFIRLDNGQVINNGRGTLSTGSSGNRLTPGIRGH